MAQKTRAELQTLKDNNLASGQPGGITSILHREVVEDEIDSSLNLLSDGAQQVFFDDIIAQLGETNVQGAIEELTVLSKREILGIRTAADLPPLISTPKGMRHPIAVNQTLMFLTPNIDIFNGFWFEDAPGGFRGGRFIGITLMRYHGTDALFAGGNNMQSTVLQLIHIEAVTPGTPFYDTSGTSQQADILSFMAVINFDLGNITGNRLVWLSDTSFVAYTAPLKIHNVQSVSLRNITFNQLPNPSSINSPGIVITGANNNVSIADCPVLGLKPGESFIAIDKESSGFHNIAGSPFNLDKKFFFEVDKTSSITAFADLSVLFTGNATSFADDGNGLVRVTQVAHGYYNGLIVNQSGTANYNGNNTIVEITDLDSYVIDVAYVSDESGVFPNTGIGSRVTTSLPHNITHHRHISISGTPNYDSASVETLNNTSLTFDIATVFVADDATGTTLLQSLDESDIHVKSFNNGSLPDSEVTAALSLAAQQIVPIVQGVYSQVGGVNWINKELERFTVDVSGMATYIGLNPKALRLISGATISKDGGGADTIATRLCLNGPAVGGNITEFADSSAAPGVDTTVTSAAHGFTANNTIVDISGTPNYDGTHQVSRIVDEDHYDIATAFVADDATGSYVTVFHSDIFSQAQTANSTPTSVTSRDIVTFETGDRFYLGTTNISGSASVVFDLATVTAK